MLEHLGHIRADREELGELVGHDQQRPQRLQMRFGGGAGGLVVPHIFVSGGLEHLLAAHHLTADHVLETVQLVAGAGQVAHHALHVRQMLDRGERRLTLEVAEQKLHRLRRVQHRHRQHERQQMFRLARPRLPGQHAVRAHPALGTLLEVQPHHLAGRGLAQRDAQPLSPGHPLPHRARIPQPRIGDAEQIQKLLPGPGIGGPIGQQLGGIIRGMPTRQRPRQHLGLPDAQEIRCHRERQPRPLHRRNPHHRRTALRSALSRLPDSSATNEVSVFDNAESASPVASSTDTPARPPPPPRIGAQLAPGKSTTTTSRRPTSAEPSVGGAQRGRSAARCRTAP